MKKLLYFFSLAALLATASCKDDDGGSVDPSPEKDNKMTYDGDAYEANSGAIEDYGNDEYAEFYNYDFYLTDGEYEQDGDGFEIDGDHSIIFYAALYSPSSDKFKTGTFEFVEDESEVSEDDYIFPLGIVLVDKNNNGAVDDDVDEFLFVEGGEVEVSGSNRKYTLKFDVELDNGEKLKGQYSGDFVYSDLRGQTELERQAGSRTKSKLQALKQNIRLK